MAHGLTVVSAVAVPAPRLKALVSILQSSSNHPFFLFLLRLGRPHQTRALSRRPPSFRRLEGDCCGFDTFQEMSLAGGGEARRRETGKEEDEMLLGREMQSLVSERESAEGYDAFPSQSATCYSRRAAGYCIALRALGSKVDASERAELRVQLPLPLKLPPQIFRTVRRLPVSSCQSP